MSTSPQGPRLEGIEDTDATVHRAYVYAIFPYLKTYRSVSIRGVRLHPSSDLSDIPEDARGHVLTLTRMFFLRGDYRIREMAYALFPVESAEKLGEIFERVRLTQTLLAYRYASPVERYPDLFLKAEQATVCLLMSKKFSPFLIEGGPLTERVPEKQVDEDSNALRPDIPGYEGLFDFHSPFWVTDESRIYPPYPDMTLNISQDIWSDVELYLQQSQNWPMERIFRDESDTLDKFDSRILTSMEWYNRSTQGHVAPEEALIDLSIAFESLLGLKRTTQVTERFEESIQVLLGDLPRLDSWLNQFYSARSAIVHEGATPQLRFLSVDSDRVGRASKNASHRHAFLPLVSYGWQIYRLCLMTVLTGQALTSKTSLKQSLVHSQERIERICKELSTADIEPLQRILSIEDDVEALRAHWLVSRSMVSYESVVAACRLAIEALIEILGPEPKGNLAALSGIANVLREYGVGRADQIRIAEGFVGPFVPAELEETDMSGRACAAVAQLLDFAAGTIPIRFPASREV